MTCEGTDKNKYGIFTWWKSCSPKHCSAIIRWVYDKRWSSFGICWHTIFDQSLIQNNPIKVLVFKFEWKSAKSEHSPNCLELFFFWFNSNKFSKSIELRNNCTKTVFFFTWSLVFEVVGFALVFGLVLNIFPVLLIVTIQWKFHVEWSKLDWIAKFSKFPL